MKRSTRITVSIIAAAITFASLMVFAKPMHGFRQRDKSHFGYTHHHDCNRGEEDKKQEKGPKQGKDLISADSSGSAQ